MIRAFRNQNRRLIGRSSRVPARLFICAAASVNRRQTRLNIALDGLGK
jgi:hypothetical protein